jgi:hypothetical protein
MRLALGIRGGFRLGLRPRVLCLFGFFLRFLWPGGGGGGGLRFFERRGGGGGGGGVCFRKANSKLNLARS